MRNLEDDEIPFEIVHRYINNPNFCPYCGSDQIKSLTPITMEESNGEVVQAIGCVDCTNMWLDMYQITYIVPLVEDDDEEEPF